MSAEQLQLGRRRLEPQIDDRLGAVHLQHRVNPSLSLGPNTAHHLSG